MKESLEGAREALSRAFDLMFSLSIGALALSVTFRGSIAPEAARELWLLSLAWVGFTLCSLSRVFGLLLSASVDLELAEKLNVLVDARRASGESKLPPGTAERLITKGVKARIAVPHFVMSFSFSTAVIAFLVFALVNNV